MKKMLTYNLSAIEIYNLIKNNKLKQFPKGFWAIPDCYKEAGELTRYVFEDVLMWDMNKIKNNVSASLIRELGLNGMFQQAFKNNIFKLIDNAYPNKFKPWQLSCGTQYYWNVDNCIIATKWLIEENLKWTDEEIKTQITCKTFINNGLRGMLGSVCNNSCYTALNYAYPNRFKPWELTQVHCSFWTNSNIREAIVWLINERLKWTVDEVKCKISNQVFADNGLQTLVKKFNGSACKALVKTLPELFDYKDFNKKLKVQN